jgi:deoxyribodipyrimidine photolyase
MADQLLKSLSLPEQLSTRVFCRVPPAEDFVAKNSFILYLPTVVLRRRHNPAFALACRLANYHQVPVVVLYTGLDDQHLSRQPLNPIAMTARRLAFTLEALQHCVKEWEEHGAGVAIRLHGPGARNPHHLTLVHKALAVISDEPFVEPFRTYLRKVTISCQGAKVPCFSVDGSTTVPPKSKLKLAPNQPVSDDFCFQGAPGKAWIWEKQTNPNRKPQVHSAIKDGHLDAPELDVKLPANFFLRDRPNDANTNETVNSLSSAWNKPNLSGPGQRPWTVSELLEIGDVKDWVMKSWPGADTSIPPCRQTHGSASAAQERWKHFRDHHLKHYAKRRNQIVDPHAVSRISCYLNLGVLSIFDVVYDVWQVMATRTGYSDGARKFLDEVVKWREIGYVHAFASPNYHTAQAIPQWAQDFLGRQNRQPSENGYTYSQLESAATGDDKWDAMQRYLIETGELHNNARMTWGKTVVHWQVSVANPGDVLWQLCCLNDRFALDGLSPPSYAGVLWCFGWCDKPSSGGSVSTKWARRYRKGPDGFEEAKERLYETPISVTPPALRKNHPSPAKKPRLAEATNAAKSPTILKFFAPVAKKSS